MRAMAIDGFGGPEKLRQVALPRPKPTGEQVLIRTVAAGVNPIDWKIRAGSTAVKHAFPLIPGFDVAGVIEELGERSTRFRKGDRVWAFARESIVQWGCYADYVAVDESSVGLMPSKLLYEEAAAVPLAALAAWQALFDEGGVSAEATVLIHGAAGGIGHFAVQLARNAGVKVLGTGGPEDRAFLHELGAAVVIDRASEDYREVVRRHVPDGLDLVIDTVGAETASAGVELLKDGGRVVNTAAAGAPQPEWVVRPSGERLGRIKALVDQGKLGPHVCKIYSLGEAPEAQRRSEEGDVRGKLVLNL